LIAVRGSWAIYASVGGRATVVGHDALASTIA